MASDYGVCVYILYEHRTIFAERNERSERSGALLPYRGQGEAVRWLRGDYRELYGFSAVAVQSPLASHGNPMEPVRLQCSCRTVSASFPRKSYGARTTSVHRLCGEVCAIAVAGQSPFFHIKKVFTFGLQCICGARIGPVYTLIVRASCGGRGRS